MPYKTVIVLDEKMPVSSEKSLDDKFKPEAEWRTAYLTGEHAKEEVLGEVGDLKEGMLKIKTQLDLHDDMCRKIPVLIYMEAPQVKEIMECESKYNKDFSKMNLIEILRGRFSSYDSKRFYECKNCGGYIEGHVEAKEFDDVGVSALAGSAGTDHNCQRCGNNLSTQTLVYS